MVESLVQELEQERKTRQQQAAEREQVKSPLQGSLLDTTSTSSITTASTMIVNAGW